jgi:hypothetical protein
MDEMATDLWMRLLEIPGIGEGESSWGDDRALWVNAKQVANFDQEDLLELRLTRPQVSARRTDLKGDSRVVVKPGSDWLRIHWREPGAADLAVELARLAAAAHLPSDGTAPKPPPSGTAMERRKRFH